MTCTFTVGRAGLDVTEMRIQSWAISGDQVGVSGLFKADTIADARVLRQQLNGYVGNEDEPTVPVTWLEDPTVDGFYRVADAQVSTTPRSTVTQGLFAFALTLERVRGYSSPIIETTILGAVRVNDYSIVSADCEIGVPAAVTEFYDDATSPTLRTFTTADGDVVLAEKTGDFQRRQTWTCPPADYYVGSARIEVGASKVPITGHQVQSETDWRLSNGLLRVTASNASFLVSIFDGTTWSTAKQLDWLLSESSGTTQGAGVHILRNSPEECIVRAMFTPPTVGERLYCDVALRRGERMARFSWAMVPSPGFSVKLNVAEAGTATSNYIEATAADGDGHKYVFVTPHTATADTVQGGFEWAAGLDLIQMGFGLDAQPGDNAAGLRDSYMYAGSERAVVAAR